MAESKESSARDRDGPALDAVSVDNLDIENSDDHILFHTHDTNASHRLNRKMTEKGLSYTLQIKYTQREKLLKQLNKKTKEIKIRMNESVGDDRELIRCMYSDWMDLYEDYLVAHESYNGLVDTDLNTLDHQNWFEPNHLPFVQFKHELVDWFCGSKGRAAGRNVADVAVKEADSVSQVSAAHSRKSERSRSSQESMGSSLSLVRVQQKQKEAELVARIAALKCKRRLEESKLKLKMEEEEFELRTEIEVVEARGRVLERFEHHQQSSFKQPNQLKGTPDFALHGAMNGDPALNPDADVFRPLRPEYRPNIPHIPDNDRSEASNVDELMHAGYILSVVRELRKPASTIKCFDGDPMEFRRFIRQFNTKIIDNCDTDDERLSYLDQYTSGKVNKIVTGYSHLNARYGYPAVIRELEERYGDVEVIANAYVQKALNWPNLKSDDARALDEFAIFIAECENAVSSIEAIRVLEYAENMRKLVAKLPFHFYDRWRNVAQSVKNRHGIVKFTHLVQFLKKEAKKAMDPTYGREAMSAESRAGGKSQVPRFLGNSRSRGSFATEAVEVERGGETRNFARVKNDSDRAAVGQFEARRSALVTPCLSCGDQTHVLGKCRRFRTMNFDERMNFLRAKYLCFGCLEWGHQSKFCRARASCEVCQRRHPTVLHDDDRSDQKSEMKTKAVNDVHPACSNPLNASVNIANELDGQMGFGDHTGVGDGEVTMAVLPVVVYAKNGSSSRTYAFLEPGSSISFVSASLVKRLGVSGKSAKITLDTMGVPHTMNTSIVTGLQVCGLAQESSVRIPMLYVKDKLPVSHNHIPTEEDLLKWEHLREVKLPQIDSDVELLIGNGIPDAYTPMQVITGPCGTPHAVRTCLGWVVWNVVRDSSPDSEADNYTANRVEVLAIEESEELSRLDRLVRSSINLDFPDRSIDDKRENSREDIKFTEKVAESMTYERGHYQISLPFRDDSVQLPDNQSQARRRLVSLEKRLRNNPKFHEDYTKFMGDILEKGYGERVLVEERCGSKQRTWYLPHHGVYHPRKPEKLRVVFDCSAKFQGVSLNDVLLQGPDLTNNLLGVFLRFREEPVAVTADVEAMFYQVRVSPEDRDCLRFLWWPDGDLNEEPIVYRMRVYPFGMVSSPSCANFALRRVVEDNKDSISPEARETVLKNFYVDDCLKSVATKEKAIALYHDLRVVSQKGGFHLTKWMTNDREVLEEIPPEERAKGVKNLNLDCGEFPVERVLGVHWNIKSDVLGFSIVIREHPVTRRGILSVVSLIYDPLGFAAPFMMPAKLILQDLCRRNFGWDQVVSDEDLKKWQRWLRGLPNLEKLAVQRCFKPVDFGKVVSCQLHNFADASEVGYGSVSYLRLTNERGDIHCSLVIGKSRVTPLKKVTIPRLELTAATLAVRMDKLLTRELDLMVDVSYFWTDSMSVRRYISNDVSRFHTFVANRIAVIREAPDVCQWRYVHTKSNPADDASRGLQATDMEKGKQWLHGPQFLWMPEAEWPTCNEAVRINLERDDPEVKISVNTCIEAKQPLDKLMGDVSKWSKLKRVVGWILLFGEKTKRSHEYKQGIADHGDAADLERIAVTKRLRMKPVLAKKPESIVSSELTECILKKAEVALCYYVQREHFPMEIKELESGQRVRKSSPLYKIDPILDRGLLRVGGRLHNASLMFDVRHPIVLHRDSRVSRLMLEDIHRQSGHMGRSMMSAELQQKYWIPQVSPLLKNILSKCVTCRRYRCHVGEQKMADLPADRLIPDEPAFNRTGVDYFGPIEVKRGRSYVKRYGVLFTCLASRAIHLEVAASLDTDSCINVIRRFISRRGHVSVIRSDNGTNLVGAEREMREELAKWNQAVIHDSLVQQGVKWVFNPPAGSHFGGVWERQIRTVRKVMYGLLREHPTRLDDESLHTLLCEVEAIVNRRPITTVSTDPEGLEPLTPNHALLPQTKASLPPGVFVKGDTYSRRRWHQIQCLVDVFWRRWTKEYLPSLQTRQKWLHPHRNVVPGDIVILVDSASPRGSWPLGRVSEVYGDRRGVVRSAKVKTTTSVLVHPVDKMSLILEVDD